MLEGWDIELRLYQELANINDKGRLHRHLTYYAVITTYPFPYIVQKQP